MSVMVKDRHLAKSQFENTFEKFYLDTTRILHGTSKRRQSSICEDLTYLINTMYDHIMVISEHRFAKSSRARRLRHDNVIAALQMIPQLEKYTMVYSNVTCKPFAKQCNWVSTLNVEVKLLNGLLDNESEKIEYIVGVLDWDKMKSFKVLSNMSYLHRFVHGKTVKRMMKLYNKLFDGYLMIKKYLRHIAPVGGSRREILQIDKWSTYHWNWDDRLAA